MSQSPTLEDQVRAALAKIKDPETGRPLKKQIHGVEVSGSKIDVKVGLTSYANPLKDDFQTEITEALQRVSARMKSRLKSSNIHAPLKPKAKSG